MIAFDQLTAARQTAEQWATESQSGRFSGGGRSGLCPGRRRRTRAGADPENGCNTRFVADALAKFLKIHAREVSFAGQKDKHAVTEQWLCARVPGKEMPDLSKFQLEGCQVLEYARHKRKLRLGALKGNQFTVILREISDRQDVETRLQAIAERGVPNYFGAQRFGIGGSNLQGAMRWAESGAPVRDRNKRSFWLSAARSALFNQQVSIRLKKRNLIRSLMAMRYN